MQFTDKIPSYKYDQFIGIIWGTENPEEFSTLTGKLPVFLFPLGSRCILSYQLAFLAKNLIHRKLDVKSRCDNSYSN